MKREVNMRYVPRDEKHSEKQNKTVAESVINNKSSQRINTDPLGMWTGVPTGDLYEEPVQDADDL